MGLKTVQLLFKGLQYRRESKYERGGTPPLSKIIAKHNDRARMQSSTRYVKARIEELRQITWEQQPITDLAYGQRLYDEGIAIANRAEGDHKKLGAAIHCFVQFPGVRCRGESGEGKASFVPSITTYPTPKLQKSSARKVLGKIALASARSSGRRDWESDS